VSNFSDEITKRTALKEESPARLVGAAASPGVIVGRVLLLDRRRVTVARRHIEEGEIVAEVARLRNAIEAARGQLNAIKATLPDHAQDHGLILDAHLLMLDDELLVDEAEASIRTERVNAEWGLRLSVEKIKELFDRASDDYFRERRSDVDFVGERVLRQLMGQAQELPKAAETSEPTVLVAHELSPADTAQLRAKGVSAFVTDVGSATSHSAILARALQLPAVVGVHDATKYLANGDRIVVDGLRGVVILRPNAEQVAAAEERRRRYSVFVHSLENKRDQPASMLCGTAVALRANIELPSEAAVAKEHGAEGVGLYRTEFLYIDRRTPPSEDEQYEVYRAVIAAMAPRMVTLRTFDIGGDKFSTAFRMPKEMNPALGLRAIRLALREKEVFRAQLRAMLRAAVHGAVRIMIPMVATMVELRAAKAEVELSRRELAERGVIAPEVPIGIMIETPSAVFIADLLARESAFFSIGTNDLVQYSLAIDRGNEHVAYLARPMDPSILRAISLTARAAQEAAIPCALCGALASDLLAAPLLVGLGVGELSVDPHAVPAVKAALSRISLREAREVASRAVTLDTADAVDVLLRETFAHKLSDLLSAGE
jgi:phosphotransferase system enzyme I (PtsI)